MKRIPTLRTTLLITFLLTFLLPLASVFANSTVTIDFGTYPSGTPASAINEPGFHFGSAFAETDGVLSTLNIPGDLLIISLDKPAITVTFDYQTPGFCISDTEIELFLNNVSVYTKTIQPCTQGTFNQAVTFDRMKFSVASGSSMLISAMTFTLVNLHNRGRTDVNCGA